MRSAVGQKLSCFVNSPEIRSLLPAFALNAGHCSAHSNFRVFHSECYRTKTCIILSGALGHWNELPSDTAGEKLSRLLDCVYNMNAAQERSASDDVPDDQFTSVKLTIKSSGSQNHKVMAIVEALVRTVTHYSVYNYIYNYSLQLLALQFTIYMTYLLSSSQSQSI